MKRVKHTLKIVKNKREFIMVPRSVLEDKRLISTDKWAMVCVEYDSAMRDEAWPILDMFEFSASALERSLKRLEFLGHIEVDEES